MGHSRRQAGFGQLQLLQLFQVLVSKGEELPVALLHRALLLSYAWVPPDVVRHPEFQVTHAGDRTEHHVRLRSVEGVQINVYFTVDQGPKGHGLDSHFMLIPRALTVVEERPKPAAVQVVQDCQQEALVELKGGGKLFGHLPHAVNELYKNRRSVLVGVVLVTVTYPRGKLVSKTDPFFFN